MSFTKNFNRNIFDFNIDKEVRIANEAIALYDEGLVLKEGHSIAAMRGFTARVNSTLATGSHGIGLEQISTELFDVNDEGYVKESFGEVLNAIFETVKRFIRELVARIRKFINDLGPVVAIRKKKQEQWKREQDLHWANFYKDQGFSKYNYEFTYEGESPVADPESSMLEDMHASGDLVIKLINSFEQSFQKNYPDYFDNLTGLIYKFDKEPDKWQAFPLSVRSAPGFLRMTAISSLKKQGYSPSDETSENFYAFKSENLPCSRQVIAFIGKDFSFHLGETPNVFDSEMKFVENPEIENHWTVIENVPDYILSGTYCEKLKSVLEKLTGFEKVVRRTSDDLESLNKLLDAYERSNKEDDHSYSQVHDRKIAGYLMKAIRTYNNFIVKPNAELIRYTLHYVDVGNRVLAAISEARKRKLAEFKKVTNP